VSGDFSLHVSTYADCAVELIAFRNANRADVRERAYFDWRYRRRPCSLASFVVWAKRGDEPVGALSVFPHDYFIVDGECPLGVIGDVSVSEECRGRGVAGAMLEFLTNLDAVRELRGCLVLPNDIAARSFAKAGWIETDRIVRSVKLLDFNAALTQVGRSSQTTHVIAAAVNGLTRLLSWEVLFDSRGWHAEICSVFDEQFDALWSRSDKRGMFLSVRDTKYLRWRFEQHPSTHYRVVAFSNRGTLRGYAVFRVEGGVCLIDDMFCENPMRHATVILGLLLRYLRYEENVARVSVSMNSGAGFPWCRFGFVRRADYQRVMRCNLAPGESSAPRFLTAGDKDV
jgi:GNAT superfamily N-acetyltransferase